MLSALLAISILPRIDAGAEVAHGVGFEQSLRGTIELHLDMVLINAASWHLDLFTSSRTFVRSNTAQESPVRISPQQINYPVGLRLRFPNLAADTEWGLFAMHQSNHDIDESDPEQNRETLSYEQYGVEMESPRLLLSAGVYYDRGTRLDGAPQTLPFEYYLAGVAAEGDWPIPDAGPLYLAGGLNLVAHRGEAHSPSFLNVSGHADLGGVWHGEAGDWRAFIRLQRIEDYQYLGDTPRHLLLVGTALGRMR